MLGALLAGGGYMVIGMPGSSYRGPLDFTAEEKALAERLRGHVVALAGSERNTDLDRPARYIAAQLGEFREQEFSSGGRTVRNVEAGAGAVVVGAHYDTVPGSPGADDNASGVAVLVELARMKLPARFVAFANEEMPYFQSGEMGSHAWAARAKAQGDAVKAMISLEMLGYYRDEPGSQQYPPPLSWFYPDRGDFIAFVGDLGARSLVRQAIGAFRAHTQFPSEGVAAPASIPGVTWSDHWSFRQHNFPAIMVTDTAFYRYPHYHLPSDTPEKLDYLRMARVTLGLASVIRELTR
ncbi:MAG TPA: M28 family peptidase [Burkholderiales bacterium]|nr:M28 family peptidase [Burkholderiales bacterium]